MCVWIVCRLGWTSSRTRPSTSSRGRSRSPAADIGFYEWSGSTIEYHRSQIHDHLGFRECSVADADKLTDWLAASAERNPDLVRTELFRHCPAEGIEPPTPPRVTLMVR
jgi:hypothetical protein